MNWRWFLFCGFALLLIVPGAFWLLGPAHDVKTVPSQVDTPSIALQWRVGISQQYRIQTDSSMQMGMNGTNSAQSMRIQLHGTLDMLTLEAGTDTALVGIQLTSVKLQVNDQSDAETNSALSVPFRVRYASGGMPTAFEFPTGVTAQNRSILENLVRMFQVTIADDETWAVQESNGSGSYEALYQRKSPSEIEKSKQNFNPSSSSMFLGAKISSKEVIRIEHHIDWLVSMTVEETLKSYGQAGPAITVNNHATLYLQSSSQSAASSDNWSFVAGAAESDSLSLRSPIPDISTEEARNRILATVPELDAATRGRSPLIHRLRDLLRVDDSLPAVLLEVLKTEQLNDRTRADLYLAFELAGTVSAQAALVSVFSNGEWPTGDALRAIVAMGGVTTPNAESVSALWDIALSTSSGDYRERLASPGAYALGNLGRSMNAADDPDYASLRTNLLNNALSGAEIKQRTDFIYAVGNTKDTTLAEDIVILLDDAAPSVRRATAKSLGMLVTDQSAYSLMTRFNQENNSQVRGAIAESLVSWTEPTESAMATFRVAVSNEIDVNTRYNLARILGANLDKFPENETVLRELIRTEPSKRIRQSIAESLATNTSNP